MTAVIRWTRAEVKGSRTTGVETYRVILICDEHTAVQYKPGDIVEIRKVEK